ncbi:MAG TPA: HAMP domain-containing sensor histidine kinase [Planctomycetota bacterium]|nr:HAMP domain-containing sensor histidine kinase [Planctomycetota bacterium]
MRTLRTRMALAFGGVFLAAWLVLGWWIADAVSRQATAHLQDRVKQLSRLAATTVGSRSIVNLTPETAQSSLTGLKRTFSLVEANGPGQSDTVAADNARPADDIEILLVLTQSAPTAGEPPIKNLYGTFPTEERIAVEAALHSSLESREGGDGAGSNGASVPAPRGEAWPTEARFPIGEVRIQGRAYHASVTSWLEMLPREGGLQPPHATHNPVETVRVWLAATDGLFLDMRQHDDLPEALRPLSRRHDLVVLYPESAVERARWEALRPILPVGILALVTVLVIAFWLAGRLSRSLAELAVTAGKVARGELDTPVEVHAPTIEVAHLQTAFVQMLAGLKESRGKLAQAERLAAIGTLATAVAHDIRTPLTSIKMTVEMQMDKIQKAGGDLKPFQVIQTEIERLRILADSLIDFARNPPPAVAETSLTDLVQACLELMAPQFKHHRVQCDVEIAPADLRVTVDARRFRQVLLNLLSNSIEATEREGRIRIEGAARNGDEPGWRLTITDNGAGIGAEILPRVFEPLVSSKAAGGGLGLTICKQIVEAHGGKIRAESPVENGRGTRVVMEFSGKKE